MPFGPRPHAHLRPLLCLLSVCIALSIASVSWIGAVVIDSANGGFETGLSGITTQGDIRL